MRNIATFNLFRGKGYDKSSRELPKGVYKIGKQYRATAWDSTGKTYHIGLFPTAHEAEYARRLLLHGHHWKGMPLEAEKYWGFTYLITNRKTGRMYVGKKQFRLWDGPTGGYKCTDPQDKVWFDESVWKENDWQTYTGSSHELNAEIKKYGVENFEFKVLKIAHNKLDLHLKETLEMMDRNVLEATMKDGEYLYYNKNIAGMEYRAPFRKHEMKEAEEKTREEVKRYYLKPSLCIKCASVVKYPGGTVCEKCSS